MNEILDRWREYLLASYKSDHTIRSYLLAGRQFFECAKEKGFDPLVLDRKATFVYLAFLSQKYTSKATIMQRRDGVKQLYRFMVGDKFVKQNPFALIDRMKVEQKPPKFLSQDEAAKLLDSIAINPALTATIYGRNEYDRHHEGEFLAIRDKALLELLYSCGTRSQETANLNWMEVDFRAGFIRVNNGKGGKDRIAPIGELALTALWNYGIAYREYFDMEPSGKNPIFQSRRQMRLTTRSIQRAVNLRLKLAGIDTTMSTHGLRHSFATHMMQNGAGIVEIAKCLGHVNLSTTTRYTQITMNDVLGNYDRAHSRA